MTTYFAEIKRHKDITGICAPMTEKQIALKAVRETTGTMNAFPTREAAMLMVEMKSGTWRHDVPAGYMAIAKI